MPRFEISHEHLRGYSAGSGRHSPLIEAVIATGIPAWLEIDSVKEVTHKSDFNRGYFFDVLVAHFSLSGRYYIATETDEDAVMLKLLVAH